MFEAPVKAASHSAVNVAEGVGGHGKIPVDGQLISTGGHENSPLTDTDFPVAVVSLPVIDGVGLAAFE